MCDGGVSRRHSCHRFAASNPVTVLGLVADVLGNDLGDTAEREQRGESRAAHQRHMHALDEGVPGGVGDLPGDNVSMHSEVTLRPLNEILLLDLLDAAVADADPLEVMPPLEGPAGWTAERRTAFSQFHRSRSLSAEPVETTYAIVVGETVVGAARLFPLEDAEHAVEAGVWIGKSHRGSGVGGAVFRQLLDLARADGVERLFASTTAGNTATLRLLTALNVDLVHEGDAVTAWVELVGREGRPGVVRP